MICPYEIVNFIGGQRAVTEGSPAYPDVFCRGRSLPGREFASMLMQKG
jgi:hypothetical protein